MGKLINNIFNNSKSNKRFTLNFDNPEDFQLFNKSLTHSLETGMPFKFSKITISNELNESSYSTSIDKGIKEIITIPAKNFNLTLDNGMLVPGSIKLIDNRRIIEFSFNDIVILNLSLNETNINCIFNINLEKIDSSKIGLESFEKSLYLIKNIFKESFLKKNNILSSFFNLLNNNYLFFYMLDKVERELKQKLLSSPITFENISSNYNSLLEIYTYLCLKKPIKYKGHEVEIGFDKLIEEKNLNIDKNRKIKIAFSDRRTYKILEKELNLFFCNILFDLKVTTINETSVVIDIQNSREFYLASCAFLNSENQAEEMMKITSYQGKEYETFENAETLESHYRKFKNKNEIRLSLGVIKKAVENRDEEFFF